MTKVNHGLTVNDLWAFCVQMRKMGLGKKEILISGDDECNSFHTLWSGFEADEEQIALWKGASDFHDNDDPKDVVLLM